MLKYTLKRLALSLPSLLAVLTLVFVIVRIVPGDPAMVVLGDQASPEALAAMREKLGLDQSIPKQYLSFMSSALQGDLGLSLVSGKAVITEILNVLPHTIDLTIAGLIVGVVFGLPFGVLSAVRRNSWIDYLTRTVSLLGLSFPAFYSAILLLLV